MSPSIEKPERSTRVGDAGAGRRPVRREASPPQPGDRQARILDAVLAILSRKGISGVSMRAVAAEAGVALGLVNYHYKDKTSLIAAALRRVGERDLAIVNPDPALPPVERLVWALRRVVDPEFLSVEYLALRLQLWALAPVDEAFAHINSTAQSRYRAGLAALIQAARPELAPRECELRAGKITIIQNGVWLTSLLGLDDALVRRSLERTEQLALGG
jgi:TetR/AcrR family transcriptional regulator, cholesterol catabolism regulator